MYIYSPGECPRWMKSRRAAVEPVPTADGPGPIPSFASAKREILLHLKREGEADLEGLSRALGISRMGVYRHVKDLEHGGLVERTSKRTGVGRPRLSLHLAPGASTIFPTAYASLTCSVLPVAEQYGGACEVENELFRRILRAEVDTTHRVVAGDHVCRFLIRPRPGG